MQILHVDVVCPASKHLDLRRAHYIHNGEEHDWFYASRPTRDAVPDVVVIIPIVGDEICLIREFRVPINDYIWQFPAGVREGAEPIRKTASRELLEETGLKMGTVLWQSPPIFSSPGLTDESAVVLACKASGHPTSAHNEAAEDITVHLFNKRQARELMWNPNEKFAAKCWLPLSWWANNSLEF